MRAADCVIAYALPTSQTGFIHKLRSRSHYVSGFAGGWPQYRTTCELIRRGIATCRRYGVEVREEVHAGELPSLFRYETVILFAHSVDKTGDQQSRQTAGQTIELWDAYVGPREMVSAVPPDYDGTIDLCVCHPIEIVQALKKNRRKAAVKYAPDLLLPSVWAEIYATMFGVADQPEFRNMAYAELLESVVIEYRRQVSASSDVRRES